MKIKSKDEYIIALEKFKNLFHNNSCAYDLDESNELLRALEEYESKEEEEEEE